MDFNILFQRSRNKIQKIVTTSSLSEYTAAVNHVQCMKNVYVKPNSLMRLMRLFK